ncbi:MAG: hypothetical protein LAO77_06370 [Acidobacteriia bacterium]|nr:hypothetical protein [Terriglobia bacterium]
MASLMIALLAAVTGLQAAPSQPQPAAPKPPASGTATQAPASGTASQPPQAEVYTYQPEGRRDPFLSLVGTGGDSRSNARRGDGVHQGDKLADGTIKTITPQGLVVMQEVNDPLSLVKQREVTKLLRSLEGAKE